MFEVLKVRKANEKSIYFKIKKLKQLSVPSKTFKKENFITPSGKKSNPQYP